MNKKHAKLAFAALAGLGGVQVTTQFSSAAIVINEVYGGGGSTTSAAFNQDFIELVNNSLTDTISTGGLILQYAPASNTTFVVSTTSNAISLPTLSLAPGEYYLVGGQTGATYVGAPIPTPDAAGPLSLSATSGEVVVFTGIIGSSATAANTVDLVGYGTAAQHEGLAAAPQLTAQLSDNRTASLDTNQNGVDFTTASPTPTNSAGVTGAVPEPATLGLIAAGSALLISRRKRV